MRVIAGSARRLILLTPEGKDTRPTTDRIKETLFNTIQFDVPGCSFLDLFSGSGAIAIEALSRGAKSAVLIDNNPRAIACINANLIHTRLDKSAEVLTGDAILCLKRLDRLGQTKFDIIYMDPPYDRGLEDCCIDYLLGSSLIHQDTLFITEMKKEADIHHFYDLSYKIEMIKIKEYKTNKHVFFKKATIQDEEGNISR